MPSQATNTLHSNIIHSRLPCLSRLLNESVVEILAFQVCVTLVATSPYITTERHILMAAFVCTLALCAPPKFSTSHDSHVTSCDPVGVALVTGGTESASALAMT